MKTIKDDNKKENEKFIIEIDEFIKQQQFLLEAMKKLVIELENEIKRGKDKE